jgi:energy-coupling factor transporter ATP-binding protein EcfA2
LPKIGGDKISKQMSNEITYFAQTDFRNQNKTFGIKKPDRRHHLYIIGKTGTGKSTLLKNLIIQDIRKGQGIALIDPHGDLVDDILNYIPSARTNQVIYFNPADQGFPIGFNILESVAPELKPLIASNLISIFRNIWESSWGPRLEYILYNSVASLLDYEPSTLLGIPRLLEDKDFRARVIQKIQDPLVKNFWLEEYEKYGEAFRKEAIAPIQNKVGQFLTSSPIRNILGQVKSKIEMGFIMDNQRILLCNLAKGKIGEDKASLLGSLIVTKIFLAGLKRPQNSD